MFLPPNQDLVIRTPRLGLAVASPQRMIKEVKKVRKNGVAEVWHPAVPSSEALPTAAKDKVPATAEAPATDPDLAKDPAGNLASEAPAAPPKAPEIQT